MYDLNVICVGSPNGLQPTRRVCSLTIGVLSLLVGEPNYKGRGTSLGDCVVTIPLFISTSKVCISILGSYNLS